MAFGAAFLDELIARNPIEDVVGQYVSLTRKSNNLFGLCPFHSEKTASFSVAPEKSIYYCFGCHKGGGVVNFIMEIENLNYPDAVRFLAKRAGLEIPAERGVRSDYKQKERLLLLCKEAARFYYQKLFTDCGREARAYLVNRRLQKDTISRFGIGFAPDEWTALLDAMTKRGFSHEELLNAGLVVRHAQKGTFYDRFRNRVMFPIIDVRGSVIGFGGRVIDDTTPKYLNSPETLLFNKRKNLFALNVAKKSKFGRIILTEGYMDAIALHQYGFDSAVASLGTALTDEHANLLARYTDELVLTYDSDEAGQNAIRRALPMLQKTGMQVKILRMEGAKDPDEYLKKYGVERFRLLLEQSENHAQYRLLSLQNKYDLTADAQRVAFLKAAVELITSLQSSVEREIYGRRAAEAAGISYEAMKLEVSKAYKRRTRAEQKRKETKQLAAAASRQPLAKSFRYTNLRSAMAEEALMRMLLREPSLYENVHLRADQFSAPILAKAYVEFKGRYESGESVTIAALGEHFTSEEISHLSAVAQKGNEIVSDAALEDYINIIRTEAEKNTAHGEDGLRAAQGRFKNKQGYEG